MNGTQLTNPETIKQIGDNLRFHVDMRFKQLTLFVAFLTLSAAGIGAYGDKVFWGETKLSAIIPVSGILFTSVLLIMEVRSHLYWREHHAQAPTLWPSPSKPFFGFVTSTNAVLFLYLATLAFWSYSAHKLFESYLVTSAASLVFLFFLAYSIINYYKASKK